MRKVRITSEDGKPYRAKVIDIETGLDLVNNCTRIAVEILPAEPISATLELWGVDIGTEANAMFVMRHPTTGERAEVREITFADGSKVEF